MAWYGSQSEAGVSQVLVTESEVLEELLKLDPQKTSGSDGLDPFFFKDAAPIIAEPISYLFNLSLLSGEVPIAWKAATASPLFKGGDQADPICYWPISILPCLSKLLEKLVNNQVCGFLDVYSILSGMQSDFRSGYGCVIANLIHLACQISKKLFSESIPSLCKDISLSRQDITNS